MSTIKELESKYVFDGLYSMTEREVSELLEFYLNNPTSFYAEERTPKLKRRVDKFKQRKESDEKKKEELHLASEELTALQKKWLQCGAKSRIIGKTLTVWEYEGKEFHRWWSGSHLLSVLSNAKESDILLAELINSELSNTIEVR